VVKLKLCSKCKGRAHIIKRNGDYVACCLQCNNEYNGCDIKPLTVKNWNKNN